MPNLVWIVLACLLGGLVSVGLAVLLMGRWARTALSPFIAFAAGVMLSSACLHVLPEALTALQHSHGVEGAQHVFLTLMAGLLGFFTLERFALWRHAHGGDCEHGASVAPSVPSLILLGDGVHNFVDGILIAAAFLTDTALGIGTTLAVLLHEIPQEMGDFALLLHSGWSRRQALLANGLCSLSAVLGGVLGYFFMADAQFLLPYALCVAAASFIYIALADLLPVLHQQRSAFPMQMVLILLGMGLVPVLEWLEAGLL